MLLEPGDYPDWAEYSGWDTIGSLKPLTQVRFQFITTASVWITGCAIYIGSYIHCRILQKNYDLWVKCTKNDPKIQDTGAEI